jgi:polar amino acid transport system permease protein
MIVAVVYLVLSALYRLGFWAIGQLLFERRRRLGTPL